MSKTKHEFVFIILHYLTDDTTQSCIDSIIKTSVSGSYKIIVVDNNSPNKTGRKLKRLYKNHSVIDVLLNAKNFGFAKGNNIGIEHARSKYNPKYIVVLNNDIILTQNDFQKKITDEYKKSKFSVLGPRIISPSGKVEAYSFVPLTRGHLILSVIKLIAYLALLHTRTYHLLRHIKRRAQIEKNVKNNQIKMKRLQSVVLHGSCLIFSYRYFDYYSSGFDNRTFMYHEEQILYWRLARKGLISVYNPALVVEHDAGASTRSHAKNITKKLLFMNINTLRSSAVLMREIGREK